MDALEVALGCGYRQVSDGGRVMPAAPLGVRLNIDLRHKMRRPQSQTLLRANGSELASLEDLVANTDWVVQGRVVDATRGRTLLEQGAPFAWFADVTFEATRTFTGPHRSSFTVEILFTSERKLESFLAAPLPQEEAIAAIVTKAEGPDAVSGLEHLRLANQTQSLYRNIDGVVHLTIPEDAGFARAWAGVPFGTFTTTIAALAP